MASMRYWGLLLGFLALICLDLVLAGESDPTPPIFPAQWTAVGALNTGGFANDTYMISYDYDAQVQRIDQFIGGTQDTHTMLFNYQTNKMWMYVTRNHAFKSCVSSPYYQKMPPPNFFATAEFGGQVNIQKQECYIWKLDTIGTGKLHLWVTVQGNTPLRISSYGSRFDVSQFIKSVPPSSFDLPPCCPK